MKIYDGNGLILGRLAAVAAKEALSGEEVRIVNCEKVVVSGRKMNVFAFFKQKLDRKGYPLKSAKVTRVPERVVRRTVRGMLPWRFARGKEAFKRVMCYRGIPAEFADKDKIVIKKAMAQKLPTLYYTTIGEICTNNGGKIQR